MTALDTLIPNPRLVEVDFIDVAAPSIQAWERLRRGKLGTSPLVKTLFTIRTLPSRLRGKPASESELRMKIDDFVSSPEHPGFQLLVDTPPRELAVGAIGKVWKVDIPFRHVPDAGTYAAFQDAGFIKVAWAFRVEPLGTTNSRIFIEVRVSATDDVSWRRFRRYFHLIGPGSHIIRHALLSELARDLGRAGSGALPAGAGGAPSPEPLAPVTEALQRFAPEAQFRSRVGVDVNASAQAAMRALEQVTLNDMPLALWLGRIRYLPAKLRGTAPREGEPGRPFLQQLIDDGALVLERNERLLVTASAGKYHQVTNQELETFPSLEALQSFDKPDYQKLYVAIAAKDVAPGRSRLDLEHWTHALSERSREQFARYWLVIRPTGDLVSWLMLRAAKRKAEVERRSLVPGEAPLQEPT
jgi:hypothetical protein